MLQDMRGLTGTWALSFYHAASGVENSEYVKTQDRSAEVGPAA
jgi:hypothetical protein